MRLSYLFLHLRPLLVILVFPLVIASQSNAMPAAGSLVRICAGVAFVIGLALLLWAHWQIYEPAQWPRHRPIRPLTDAPVRLVTDGAYRHLRNPQLLGIDLMLFCVAIFLWSLPLLLYSGLIAIVSVAVARFVEEAQLEQRFGADYAQYRSEVAGFIPRLV